MTDDALQKALAAVNEASQDSKQLEVMQAVLMGQAIAQAMGQQQAQQSCQHQHREPANVGKWLAIGAAVCAGSVGIAIGFIAIAIGSVSVAILALVLRSIWNDIQKGK